MLSENNHTMNKRSTSGQEIKTDDEEQWQAVLRKDHKADGKFVYAVKTTGERAVRRVRRSAHRENVAFYNSPEGRERAVFEPNAKSRRGPSSRSFTPQR